MDLKAKENYIKNNESFLEKIKRFIPGYKGYVDRDNLRELDTILRNQLADKLELNKQKITKTVSNLSNNNLFKVIDIEKIEKKNETAISKFKTAARGYSGAFNTIKIKDEKLSKLYEYDESLLSYVEKIESLFDEMVSISNTNNDIERVVSDIGTFLDVLINKIKERENILKEL